LESALTVNTKEPVALPTVPLSPLETQIAGRYAFGDSITKISDRYEIPASVVKRILNEPDVADYVATLVDTIRGETLIEAKRLIGRIISDKIEEAEDAEISLGKTTKKDIPDLLKILQDIEKSAGGDERETPYLAIIQQMTGGGK
jgi:hypothetical protein